MTTFVFIVSMIACMIGIVICTILAYKSKKPISKYVRTFLLCTIIPVAANTLIAFSGLPVSTGNEALGSILAHTGFLFYVAGTNLMFYTFYIFCMEYCGHDYKRIVPLTSAMAMLLAIDTVSVFLNTILEHMYTLELVYDEIHREYHFVLISGVFHYFHLAISVLAAAVCLAILLQKTFTTSKLYNIRYWLIIASIIPVAGWEGYYILSSTPIDASMIGYAVCAILVYYFSLAYTSHKLHDRILSQITQSLSDGIILFNESHVCTYANDKAFKLMGIERSEENLIPMGENIKKQLDADLVDTGSMSCERLLYINDKECFYTISYDLLYDSDNVGIGSYVTIHDHTSEELASRHRVYQAKHNPITGLYSADFFYSLVRNRLDEYPDNEYYLIVGDIDEFKMINDVFGRTTGDEVLRRVAHVLDINCTNSIYSHLGADRFAMLVPKELYNKRTFEHMSRIEQPVIMGNNKHPIVLRLGVYEVVERDLPVTAMIDRAFMAIRSIKGDLTRRIAFYDESMRTGTLWEQMICGSVDDAIAHKEIMPYLQPQVDIEGKMTGAEVLVRWDHPEEGFLSPAQFIPILEEQGLIAKVDRFMWESACAILARWAEAGDMHTYLSVNISPKDFYFMDVPEEVAKLTDKYHIRRELLRLEITETLFMDDSKDYYKIMKKLQDEGFIVEMDDFGSGFSSLNMLKDIPLDVLKLDMIFLKESDTSDKSLSIVKSIVNMAHELGLSVVNEGVETEKHVSFLRSIGTETYQGYYFDKPMPVSEFEEKYMSKYHL